MELNLAANKIIQFLNSGHKCPADPRSSSGLPSKVKGLPVLPPPLLLLQSTLATLGSIPRPRSQLGESLQQAQCICPHNGHTERPPGVPNHLAQLPRSCFPTLSPAHSRHSGLRKCKQQLVHVRGYVPPGRHCATADTLVYLSTSSLLVV